MRTFIFNLKLQYYDFIVSQQNGNIIMKTLYSIPAYKYYNKLPKLVQLFPLHKYVCGGG